MISLSAVASLVLALNLVAVRSSADCPSAKEVVAKLDPLIGDAPADVARDQALIEVLEWGDESVARLRVQLIRSDGSLAGDRLVVVDGACSDKADAVAAIIAAWESDLTTSDSIASAGPPDPGRTDVHANAAVTRSSLSTVVGASGGLALVGGAAVSGNLEALVGPALSRWQARFSLGTESARHRTLDVGGFTWQHTAAAAGLMVLSHPSTWRFAVDAGPFVGWATLHGQGYSEARQVRSFDFGATGAVRLERHFGRLSLWLEGRTWIWPRPQQAVLSGSSERVKLSCVDAMVNLGGSTAIFP